MSLKEYRKKRRFGLTKEPRESRKKGAREGLIYVVQKHRASHLHYDLRLEEDGVLKSWAVPKIPANRQGVKRLAVRTEDHPLGYETFEGSIPDGEYGAGTVEIWDKGVYTPLESAPDRMVVEISGRKLKGRFVLVKIRSRDGKDNTWLFFKAGRRPPKPLAAGLLAGLVLSLTAASCARNPLTSRYGDTAAKLARAGLSEEGAFEFLRQITSVGPRLTGSPEAAAAVSLTRKLMEGAGLGNVHLEDVTVNRWIRGDKEEARILGSPSAAPVPLAVCALGGSVATPAEGLCAPVVEVRSLEELPRLGTALAGKIVFFNRPMDRSEREPFAAYGKAADQRVRGASAAARFGAVAVLVRSLTFRIDDFPHTGMLLYSPDAPQIPAAAVSTRGAETLSDVLGKEGATSVFLRMSCRNAGPVPSANVVGEITGSERPHEIILLGGHLDSWDLGTGAHDDGAGCAVSLEALRLLRTAGLKPKRTIRVVLFMDEEFGGTGGRFYAAAEERKGERHLVAMESDRGGFLPIGLAGGGSDAAALREFKSLAGLLGPLGVMSVGPGGGGVDIGPLVAQGTIPAAVVTDAQSYFDYHHSARDVLDSVPPRELELQAVIMAVVAYVLAQEGI
jgi:carboxypeptidase Q